MTNHDGIHRIVKQLEGIAEQYGQSKAEHWTNEGTLRKIRKASFGKDPAHFHLLLIGGLTETTNSGGYAYSISSQALLEQYLIPARGQKIQKQMPGG